MTRRAKIAVNKHFLPIGTNYRDYFENIMDSVQEVRLNDSDDID